jgi:predicted ester cyclase
VIPRIARLLIAMIAALMIAACTESAREAGVSAAWLQVLLIERNQERYDEFFAPDARVNGSTFAREYLRATADGLHGAFPDLDIDVLEQIVARDRVVTRFALAGTHQGPFNTLPPTGRAISFPGVSIDRLEQGRVVENWLYIDLWSMAKQLGGPALQPAASDAVRLRAAAER